jgi:iron complex transport system ATP-binding protein
VHDQVEESVTPPGSAPGISDAAPQTLTLTLRDVRFGYDPGCEIIRGLTATLEPGKLTTLIGPNAAGKSTLMRLMLGQLAPSAGSVRLGKREVSAMSPDRRAAWVSYVPQRAGVSFAFSVEQVVAMGRFAQRANPGAVEDAIRQCDLDDLRRRPLNQLSFGQQQRVLLARAMAQAAESGRIMLLDEPGSAMDLWHVHHMMGLLRELVTRGMAVLVILHDLNLAARYADEVWLLHDGVLAARGGWAEVLTPAVLEPIYRVRLRPMAAAAGERPVFAVEPAGTLVA